MKHFIRGCLALLFMVTMAVLGGCNFLFPEENSSLTSVQESLPLCSQESEISNEEESALDRDDSVLEPETSLEESSIEDSSIDEPSESSNGGFELPEDKFD